MCDGKLEIPFDDLLNNHAKLWVWKGQAKPFYFYFHFLLCGFSLYLVQ